MKVSKKDAADMVGVGRTTFYRHIEEKKISVDPTSGKIDVSELNRLYDNVMTLEQARAAKKLKKAGAPPQEPSNLEIENQHLKAALEAANLERKRERDQFQAQIDHLQTSLDKSMSQNEGLTRLLKDERSQLEKEAENTKSQHDTKLDTLIEAVSTLQANQNQKRSWWIFGR